MAAKISKLIKVESRVEVTRSCGEKGMGSKCLIGTESLFGMMKISDGCTIL